MAITKLNMPTVDKVIAGDVGTSLENPIDALIIGAGPSGNYLLHSLQSQVQVSAGADHSIT